jgi:hypothetical protein
VKLERRASNRVPDATLKWKQMALVRLRLSGRRPRLRCKQNDVDFSLGIPLNSTKNIHKSSTTVARDEEKQKKAREYHFLIAKYEADSQRRRFFRTRPLVVIASSFPHDRIHILQTHIT